MKLTPRLQAIAEKVNIGSTIADIGTDHGYIPVFLIEHNIAKRVIAGDINRGPLESADRTIKHHGFTNEIETRLGSGLEVLSPGEVDTVIIAGMGGILIRDILLNSPGVTKSIDRFILQPMTAQDEIRRWLIDNGFAITDEVLAVEDHRIYEIIVVEKGKQVIEDDIYYEIGPKLVENQDPLLEVLIHKHIKKYKDIIQNLTVHGSEMTKIKLAHCQKKVEKLEEVLKCLKDVEK